MHTHWKRRTKWRFTIFTLLLSIILATGNAFTPPAVKNVTALGPQLTPDVTYISRDGGYSVLINGNIVWLYDDTECMDPGGEQLSFVSNTAAYANQPNTNVSTVADFGVMQVGTDNNGNKNYAILADTSVGTGGWIPFQPDELDFNQQKKGVERVAIWPGTSPTPISTTQAFLFAPLVYVDSKPQDPSKEYQARGMTLISIDAPISGPIATRQGDLIISGTQVPFGGFSTLLGSISTNTTSDSDSGTRDVYMFGITSSGLQLARVGINDVTTYDKYTYWDPESLSFSNEAPSPDITDFRQIYLGGSFSSGSIFYSPYFATFVMVYFNKMVDSTFYIRYLELKEPLKDDSVWTVGGKNGQGIQAEDVEALVKYPWSAEQKLYISPTRKGGFNYAGIAHPEYFNRQYFAQSLYPTSTPKEQRLNDWYGNNLIAQADAGGDGRHLLLSWTSQLVGGTDTGIYQVELAVVEFDNIPPPPPGSSGTSGQTTSASSAHSTGPSKPINTEENMMPKSDGRTLEHFVGSTSRLQILSMLVGLSLGFLVAP